MEVSFKIATIEDIEAIVELCNECFEEQTSIEYAKRVFNENLSDKNQIYIVGYVKDTTKPRLVAHAKVTIIPTIYENMNTYAILNHICVKPEYRRHNIATKLLVECEKIAKENGCVVMELWSRNFRHAAHECYKHYGFTVDDASFFSKKIK